MKNAEALAMGLKRLPSASLPKPPQGIRVLSGNKSAFIQKIFPDLTDGLNLQDAVTALIDRRSYVGAFFLAVFLGLSLISFGATIAMFVENGFSSWEDLAFLLVMLVCLAYASLWSYGFFRQLRYCASARVCFIFLGDRIIWAEKWLGHLQTKVFYYNELDLITHGGLNGGGDVGRGLYINHDLLLSCSREEHICQCLYLMIKQRFSDREIAFRDIEHHKNLSAAAKSNAVEVA